MHMSFFISTFAQKLIIMRRILFAVLLLASWITFAQAGEIKEISVLYPSIDQNGDSLMLSGKICVPTKNKAKGIILIPHYTITSNAQAPSNKPTGEAQFFQDDYVLVMPDYLGYGHTKHLEHPYLAGELTAHNCVDMLLSLPSALDTLHLGISYDTLYIVGYSQGGASAVWTLKLLEEQYADRFHVVACYAGGGPYDVVAAYDLALEQKKVFMPIVVPMMVVGTDAAYNLHLDRESFFTPATQKIYTKYVANKEYSTSQLFFKFTNHRLSYWMSALAMDPSQPETKRLYEGFKRSSLVRYPINEKVADREIICPNWIPKAELYIFHSKNDNVVTVRCAEHLHRCLPDLPNITFDIKNYGSHTQASSAFFSRVRKMLKK